jgi:hypothetical protein
LDRELESRWIEYYQSNVDLDENPEEIPLVEANELSEGADAYQGGANGGLGLLNPGQISENGRAIANADGILVVPIRQGELPELFGAPDHTDW